MSLALNTIQGGIQDANLLRERKQMFIPANHLSGLLVESNGVADVQRSSHTGNPEIAEVGSTGVNGIKVAAVGAMINHLMKIPYDWDLSETVRLAVLWSCTGTDGTKTVTFILLYKQIQANADVAVAVGDTALNTALVADTDSATANALMQTEFGVINANVLTRERFLSLLLELDATTLANIATTPVTIHGLLIDYVPRFTGRL